VRVVGIAAIWTFGASCIWRRIAREMARWVFMRVPFLVLAHGVRDQYRLPRRQDPNSAHLHKLRPHLIPMDTVLAPHWLRLHRAKFSPAVVTFSDIFEPTAVVVIDHSPPPSHNLTRRTWGE
jgi:hypothetical protein